MVHFGYHLDQKGDRLELDTIRMNERKVELLLQLAEQRQSGEITIAIGCFGTTTAAIVPNTTCLDFLIPLLPPTWEPARPAEVTQSPQDWKLADPTSKTNGNWEAIAKYLASGIENFIAETSPDYVFVHAGAVAVVGQVVVLPGASYAGKSTLVAALVHEGATYFSDEYAVITQDGLVLPYLRHIALRNSIYFPEGRTDIGAKGPPQNRLMMPMTAKLVVVTQYTPTREAVSFSPLDRTSALIELSKNTVGFRQRPDMSFAYLNPLLDHALAYTGERGDATEAAHEILSLLRSERNPE